MHAAFGDLPQLFQQFGLAVLFVVLFLENLGLPLPGELSLLYAAYQVQVLGVVGFESLLVVGVAGSSLGQIAGYCIGRFGRRWAERGFRLGARFSGGRHAAAVAYIERHGALTILFARFVTGLRILAGPLAGLYRMPWRTFVVFDLLGAMIWVSVISSAGKLLGLHGPRLVHWVGRADSVILVVAAVAIWMAWRRVRRARARKDEGGADGTHGIKSAGVDRPVSSPVGRRRVDRGYRPDV